MEILNQAMEFTQQYSLFFLAGMFAVILILVICMTVMNSRMKELQAAYDDFMRGNDGKSLEGILKKLAETEEYGKILRSKGMLPCTDGTWMHFDLVPGEYEIRTGAADYTGRLCVIGSKLKEDKLEELFLLK